MSGTRAYRPSVLLLGAASGLSPFGVTITVPLLLVIALDFGASAFDAVWAASCLVHVPDRDLDIVLGEISRVLRRDGLCFVGLWGGEPGEGLWDDDPYDPPRFYAVRSDAAAAGRHRRELHYRSQCTHHLR